MRWLLDQGLPRSAASLLRTAGSDAVHTGEAGMACASDREILQRAAVEQRTVITLDADFHALLATTGAASPSVIRIREEGLKAQQVCALVLRIASQFSAQLAQGCVLTYARGCMRLRHLPIHR